MYSFLDYIMGGCQIQFTVSFVTYNLLFTAGCCSPCLVPAHINIQYVCSSITGGSRLHSIQWGSQKQLLPPLHPPLPAQRVPQSAGGCGRDLPGLRQVEPINHHLADVDMHWIYFFFPSKGQILFIRVCIKTFLKIYHLHKSEHFCP